MKGGVRSETGRNQSKARFSLNDMWKSGNMGLSLCTQEGNGKHLIVIFAVALMNCLRGCGRFWFVGRFSANPRRNWTWVVIRPLAASRLRARITGSREHWVVMRLACRCATARTH